MAGVRGTITYVRSPEHMAKAFLGLVKWANGMVVQRWHRHRLPVHFTHRAKAMYGYREREGGHEDRKKRRFGHTLPLVFTGASKAAMLSQVRVTSSARGARGYLFPEKYFWMRFGETHPDKPDEVTRVTEREVQALAKFHERLVTRRLNTLPRKETKVIT